MRKLIAGTLAAVMAASTLAACGSSGGSTGSTGTSAAGAGQEASSGETTAADAAASDDANTLTIWCWDPNFNIYAINKATEIYAKDHPGFNVKITENSSDTIETKLTTAISAGDLSTLPDIFCMQDNSFQKFVTNYPDIFVPLTDKGIDFSQFGAAKVAYSTVNGDNYGLPFDNGTALGCYRTDLLEQAGMTIDDLTDVSWDEFMEKAKTFKEKTGLPVLSQVAGMTDIVMMMIQSTGESCFTDDGKINLVNNEAVRKAVETYAQMVKDGTMLEVTDWNQYIGSFQNGSVLGTINGCWILGSITAKEDQSGKWGITNIPSIAGVGKASNYSNNGGSSWVVTTNSKKPDMAIDFLNKTFGGSTELYDEILPKGAFASWAPAAKSEEYNQEVPFFGNDKVYEKIVDFSTKTPANKTSPFYYDARDALGVALSQITQQGVDIDTALQDAENTVNFAMGN